MKTSREEIFELNTAGRLPQILVPELEMMIRPYRGHLDYEIAYLRKTNAQVFKNIYVDMIDERELNALAFTYGGEEFVGINAGFAYSLPMLFDCLLSHPMAFPQIGDIAQDDPYPVQFDPELLFSSGRASDLRPDVTTVVKAPRDARRRQFGAYLSVRAWDFLLLHEVGHIVRCHLPYLQEVGFLSENEAKSIMLLEFDECSHEDKRAILQVIEVDADVTAARAQVSGLFLNPPTKHAISVLGADAGAVANWDWIDVLYMWLIPIALLYQIMAILDESPLLGAGRKHPHPNIRLYIMAYLMRPFWQKMIPNEDTYLDTIVKVNHEIQELWRGLSLPSSSEKSMPSYSDDFTKAVELILMRFDDVALRLDEVVKQIRVPVP